MKKFWVIILTSIFAVGLIFSGCTTSSPATTTAPAITPAPVTTSAVTTTPSPTVKKEYGGTIRIITSTGLSPIGYTPTMSGAMIFFVNPCMEGLIWHNTNTGEFSPKLAASMEEDPAGKFIIFKLRQGVKFHDGTDFDAQAVKDYLELKKVDVAGWLSAVQSIDIIDRYTIKLNTRKIDIFLYTQLAEDISSPKHLSQGKEKVQYHPVGTGPFKFADYKRDTYLKFTRFDDYWGGKPYLDGIEYLFVPDEVTVLAAFTAGEANVIHSISRKYAAELDAKGSNLVSMWSLHQGLLPDSINPDSPYANKKVREAIDYAIDKETIAKSLGYGLLQSMDSVIPSFIRGYTPNQGRKYDPAKAKQLLAEAGYPDGFETTLLSRPGEGQDLMVAIQGYLGEVGIKAKIDLPDMGRYTSTQKTGWKNTLFHLNCMYAEPIEYYLERSWGEARKDYVSTARPPGFNDLMTKLVAEPKADVRDPMLKQLIKSMDDEAMYVPLIMIAQTSAVAPEIHNFGIRTTNPTRFDRLHEAWISK